MDSDCGINHERFEDNMVFSDLLGPLPLPNSHSEPHISQQLSAMGHSYPLSCLFFLVAPLRDRICVTCLSVSPFEIHQDYWNFVGVQMGQNLCWLSISWSTGKGLHYYRKNPTFITYGLMALSYILILALFIIVFSRSTSGDSKGNMNLQAEMSTFKKNISQITSQMVKLEKIANLPICDSGWLQFAGSCYYLSLVRSNWMKARSTCVGKQSDLAVITSEEEQQFLMSEATGKKGQRFWIGLSDVEDEGKWTWVDGSDYENSYQHWKKGEPNDHQSSEDCAHMLTNGDWNDVHCVNEQYYAICEKKPS
ncbi:hepatic lectin-like [Pelodytes ibericus]